MNIFTYLMILKLLAGNGKKKPAFFETLD